MKLVIVESPNKCKKIQSYLGADFLVVASFGHIRDLPLKEIGVSAPDYKPKYVTEDARSKKQLAYLKSQAQRAEFIYFATDPDREGEAIAWHLFDALKPKKSARISFNEINQAAVNKAINNPRDIDRNFVYAQEARRVLDRLVGYKVSSPLSRAVGNGAKLSAGRVQSPALRLLVERDRAIKNFVAISHFGVRFNFKTDVEWHADWLTKDFFKLNEEYILDRNLADEIAALKDFEVISVVDSEEKRFAPAPFTTATLIKAASARLKINTETVMSLAQKLFEGDSNSKEGYITYHRTDNPNISDEAFELIKTAVENNGDPDLLVATKNKFKSKADAQEAHEAIRPTNFEVIDLDSNDALLDAMYALIWDRAVASQLLPAKYKTRKVILQGADVNGTPVRLGVNFKVLIFKGWLDIMRSGDDASLPEDEQDTAYMPEINKGMQLTAIASKVLEKNTKPPRKMTELELIDLLERMGIGRPSTYASIMGILRKRGYMLENKRRQLEHTKAGAQVVDNLIGKFSFIDYEYTKNIEKSLDAIASGKMSYKQLVASIDVAIDKELSLLPVAEGAKQQLSEHMCKVCLKPLVRRTSKSNNVFYGCSGYPDCSQIYSEYEGAPFYGSDKKFFCTKCKEGTVQQRVGKYGVYWHCPKCSSNIKDDQGKPAS